MTGVTTGAVGTSGGAAEVAGGATGGVTGGCVIRRGERRLGVTGDVLRRGERCLVMKAAAVLLAEARGWM